MMKSGFGYPNKELCIKIPLYLTLVVFFMILVFANLDFDCLNLELDRRLKHIVVSECKRQHIIFVCDTIAIVFIEC